MGSPEAIFFDRSTNYKNRSILAWHANKAMGLNADATNAAESVRDIVGQEFEILGTNAVSADCTLDTTGGVKLSSHGGANDSTILLAHLTASMSAWTSTLWDTAKSPTWEATVKTGSVITLAKYWAGLKLTNTPTLATDDDQVFFSYNSATAGGKWQYNYSIANVDTTVTVSTDVVAAVALSTVYTLCIEIYSDRTHMGFINDKPIASQPFPALTSLTTLLPYIGVGSVADAVAKTLTVKNYEMTRLF